MSRTTSDEQKQHHAVDTPQKRRDSRVDLYDQVVKAGVGVRGKSLFEIGFPGFYGWKKTTPVHETMTIAAMIAAGDQRWAGKDRNSLSDQQWEVIRGIDWNDDPMCQLFDMSANENHKYSTGVAFGASFRLAQAKAWRNPSDTEKQKSNMLARSHFFDLQFIHGMASAVKEPAAETQSKCMLWAEFVYKIATGVIASGTTLQQAGQQLSNQAFLGQLFTSDTKVKSTDSVQKLLTNGDSYTMLDIRLRALGSLLHTIQDSYAKGHTARVRGTGTFAFDQSGPVKTFHTYKGQDKDQHAVWDALPLANIDVNNVADFNQLPGARMAVEASKELIIFVTRRLAWDDPAGPEQYLLGTVWPLAPVATAADADVPPGHW